MNIIYILTGVVVVLCLLLGAALVLIYKVVTDLADKIALPLYDRGGRNVQYVRPEQPEPKPEDANLPDRQEPLVSLDEVGTDEAYAAIIAHQQRKVS